MYFVGAVGGMERELVSQSGIAFAGYREVFAGPLHGVNPFRIVASVLKLALGSLQSLGISLRLRPQVVLLTGGWPNLPVALGARLLRIPIVIYLPDIEPGLTIKALNPFASRIAISVEPSARFFPAGKTVVTGYPLQANRLNAERKQAQAHFKLDADRRTLLVFGGSRGARNINIALADMLPHLFDMGLQIIHITGEFDWEENRERVADLSEHPHYKAFAYLHDEMGLAFAAADLAVCRAGASTLAELPLFGLPAILVPYPYAWRYQKINADFLAERGAAIKLNDEDMADKLYKTVRALFTDERRLSQMSAKSRALANPDGAGQLADLLLKVGGK